MNVLSFRNIRALSISGDIKINGRFVNRDQMNDISAYLQQEDLFLGTMTVREHLLFKVQCFIKASFFGGFCTNLSTCFRTLLWIFLYKKPRYLFLVFLNAHIFYSMKERCSKMTSKVIIFYFLP